MRFLADVNIPQSVIASLTEAGHDVLDIKKQKLDFKDSELIQIAKQEKRIILTRDKDFLLLAQFPKYQVPTIYDTTKNSNTQLYTRTSHATYRKSRREYSWKILNHYPRGYRRFTSLLTYSSPVSS